MSRVLSDAKRSPVLVVGDKVNYRTGAMCKIIKTTLLLIIASIFLTACSTYYRTPSAGVSIAAISESDGDIKALYEKQATSPFPARLSILRVQDSGYVSSTNQGYGNGRYSVVTTRDIETDEAFEAIKNLPFITAVAPIARILLPANANSLKDLRLPAAKLKSDLLLVYTVNTSFTVEGKSLGPFSLISLGLIPNKTANVAATVSGVLIDVRTGYIYGTAEATAKEEQKATIWSTELAIDTSRMTAERQAFDLFVGDFERLWVSVAEEYAIDKS